MKSAVLRKTAQVTALMMVLTLVMPVLAFAATGFKSGLVYRSGTVSGSVYSDVYSENVTSQVYIYSPDGTELGVASATYSTYDGTYNLYDFNQSGLSNYSYLRLKAVISDGDVTESVYQTVYRSGSSSGRGGGGGGGYWGSGSELTVNSDGKIDAYSLESALQNYDTVTLKLSGDFVLIPAKALEKFEGDASKKIVIVGNAGTYILPLKAVDLDSLSAQASTEIDDLFIKVGIAQADQATADAAEAAAEALGATAAGDAVNFYAQLVGNENKTVDANFGNNYMSREIALDKTVDPNKATGVVYNPTTKKLSFVPTLFSTEDDKSVATLKHAGHGIYLVVELDKSFTDVAGHWAQSNIELLANKLVVDGVTDELFQPERSITRAEFAALIVRALALDTDSVSGSTYFDDVESGEWYTGVIGAAAAAKLVDGYEDGSFRPNNSINREELAAMVVRALDYVGSKPEVSASRQAELLAKFADSDEIVWADAEIAAAIESGIVDGMTDDEIGPRLSATRAQSATMLKRLLTEADFIN